MTTTVSASMRDFRAPHDLTERDQWSAAALRSQTQQARQGPVPGGRQPGRQHQPRGTRATPRNASFPKNLTNPIQESRVHHELYTNSELDTLLDGGGR